MLIHCVTVLLLVAGSATPYPSLGQKEPRTGGYLISWEPRTMVSNADYPCLTEGFFAHPTNCSRFYRCVDFTNESLIFSRYLFECPTGNVFAASIETCIPGSCPQQLPPIGIIGAAAEGQTGNVGVDAGTGDVGTETAPDSGSEASSSGGTESGAPEVDQGVGSEGTEGGMAPTEEGGAAPAEGGAAPSEGGETPSEGGAASSEGGAAPAEGSGATSEVEGTGAQPSITGEGSDTGFPDTVPANPIDPDTPLTCDGMYQQSEKYCNIFHLCNDNANLYHCHEGTAFSEAHQMCRLTANDESLCAGKELFILSYDAFRNAFAWPEVGVYPLPNFQPVVPNSSPYKFRNSMDERHEEESYPIVPLTLPDFLSDHTNENLKSFKSDLDLSDWDRIPFEDYIALTNSQNDERARNELSLVEKDIRKHETTPKNQKDIVNQSEFSSSSAGTDDNSSPTGVVIGVDPSTGAIIAQTEQGLAAIGQIAASPFTSLGMGGSSLGGNLFAGTTSPHKYFSNPQFGYSPSILQNGYLSASQFGNGPSSSPYEYLGGSQFGYTPSTSQFGFSPSASQSIYSPSSLQFGQNPFTPQFGYNTAQFGYSPIGYQFSKNPIASQFGYSPSASQFAYSPSASQFGYSPSASQFGYSPSASQFGYSPSASQFGYSPSTSRLGYNQLLFNSNPFTFGLNPSTTKIDNTPASNKVQTNSKTSFNDNLVSPQHANSGAFQIPTSSEYSQFPEAQYSRTNSYQDALNNYLSAYVRSAYNPYVTPYLSNQFTSSMLEPTSRSQLFGSSFFSPSQSIEPYYGSPISDYSQQIQPSNNDKNSLESSELMKKLKSAQLIDSINADGITAKNAKGDEFHLAPLSDKALHEYGDLLGEIINGVPLTQQDIDQMQEGDTIIAAIPIKR